MKNKLSDLNDHLFAQLERLSEEDLVGDRLGEEIIRARAITDVAQSIIANANTAVKAQSIMLALGGDMKKDGGNKTSSLLLKQFLIDP